MKRIKVIATLTASVVAFALFPSLPAFASANATAQLTNNRAVYPGNYTYTIRLTNNEPSGLLTSGREINQIVVELPKAAGITIGDAAPTAGAFTADKRRVGGTDWVIFTGSTLKPGQSLNLNIPSVANAPNSCDLVGTWRVRVSSDSGETEKLAQANPAGSLDARVQVLEVLGGTFKPIAPTNADNSRGVTDRSGTAGQLITYEYQVKNHAKSLLSVTGSITSDKAEDKPGAAVVQSIGALGGTATYTHDIQLGAASVQRFTTFTANATSTCATAPALPDSFTVHVPVDLQFAGLTPVRVRSGANSAKTFSVTAVKTGGAQFELREGSLTFGTNNATLQGAPRTFNSGSQNLALEYSVAEILGAEGALAATITSTGEDFNLAAVNLTRAVGTITIDITAPVVNIAQVTLPKDVDNDQQTAVKKGDTVKATGEVLGTQLPAGGTDLAPGCPTVQVVPNAGASKNFSVTCSAKSDGTGINWTATISGTNTQWDDAATSFSVTAAHKDQAENEGVAVAPGPYLIDLTRPALGGYTNQFKGVVLDPTKISVQFEDDLASVRGGCDPEAWLVDNQLQVKDVFLSDGTQCSGDSDNADKARRSLSDGTRVLVLFEQFAKHPHETPTVTYVPRDRMVGFYPTKDGAQNDALTKTIDTLSKVIPPTPQITQVERKDGATYEPAYLDTAENAYYTNTGASDGIRLNWQFTTALTATEVEGYKVRVTDARGNTLNEVKAMGQNPLSGQWSGTITVPLSTIDGRYVRNLYVVSPGGTLSDPNARTFVLDTVLPTLGTSTFDGVETVTVTFVEKIVAGSNFSSDWVIGYEIQGESGTETAYTRANGIEGSDQLTRKLTITDLPDPSAYRSTDYQLFTSTRQRYEDRAGNLMLDTI